MKELLNIYTVEEALRALSDAGRRRILALVRDEERSAGEIAAQFTVTWPAVSQHLRVLKDAGLVTERREGTRRLYRARPEGLTDVRAFLDGFSGTTNSSA
jgi:DNA-binding transcriptional ArsR family regulator